MRRPEINLFLITACLFSDGLGFTQGYRKYEKASDPPVSKKNSDKEKAVEPFPAKPCRIGSVHEMMNVAYPVAKKHLRNPRLYAIEGKAYQRVMQWTFYFVDPETRRTLSFMHSAELPRSYEVAGHGSRDSYSLDPKDMTTWHLVSRIPEKKMPLSKAPCSPITSDFLDSTEIMADLGRIGEDVCGSGVLSLLHLFDPNDMKERCSFISKAPPEQLAGRNVWRLTNVLENVYFDAATGRVLWREPKE